MGERGGGKTHIFKELIPLPGRLVKWGATKRMNKPECKWEKRGVIRKKKKEAKEKKKKKKSCQSNGDSKGTMPRAYTKSLKKHQSSARGERWWVQFCVFGGGGEVSKCRTLKPELAVKKPKNWVGSSGVWQVNQSAYSDQGGGGVLQGGGVNRGRSGSFGFGLGC